MIRTGTNGQLYAGVCSYRDGELAVVDTARQRVVVTVPVGAPIRDITLNPDGAVAYVLAHHPQGAAAVIRIDLVRTEIVEVGESATQVVMSPDGAEIYVVDRDGVAVLCALNERVFESITVDARPSCVAVSSGVGRLYVADHAGDVTVLPVATPVPQAVAG